MSTFFCTAVLEDKNVISTTKTNVTENICYES